MIREPLCLNLWTISTPKAPNTRVARCWQALLVMEVEGYPHKMGSLKPAIDSGVGSNFMVSLSGLQMTPRQTVSALRNNHKNFWQLPSTSIITELLCNMKYIACKLGKYIWLAVLLSHYCHWSGTFIFACVSCTRVAFQLKLYPPGVSAWLYIYIFFFFNLSQAYNFITSFTHHF